MEDKFNSKSSYYFSYARTALKYGLESLNFVEGDLILLPELICSVILDPIFKLKLKVKYYKVERELNPDWTNLENLVIQNKAKGIVMVHYFGLPQNIDKFKSFCTKYQLILIEDNAHGFGVKLNNRYLGTYGDIGISSPRKILKKRFGGILHLNKSMIQIPNSFHDLNTISNISVIEKFKNIFFNKFPRYKNLLKKLFKNRPEYENPLSFQENPVDDFKLDISSIKEIREYDYNKQSAIIIKNYKSWKSLLSKYGYKEAIGHNTLDGTPYCFAFYVRDKKEAVQFYKWGWNNGFYIYSWPSLPLEIIDNNSYALKIWENLVCISLDIPAPKFIKNLY